MRKDVELIPGKGMLAADWQARTLNAPGKFLISAPEHDTLVRLGVVAPRVVACALELAAAALTDRRDRGPDAAVSAGP